MKWTPRRLKFLINLYPPYWGTGVHVDRISDDWRELDVSMPLRFYNRNFVGAHFGGNLFVMVDPHLMLLYMQLLGEGYTVWDKAATIKFVRPGRGRVTAAIRITDEDLAAIRDATASGESYRHEHLLEIHDPGGEVVAEVRKTLHFKRR